jgi:hypothetical protein
VVPWVSRNGVQKLEEVQRHTSRLEADCLPGLSLHGLELPTGVLGHFSPISDSSEHSCGVYALCRLFLFVFSFFFRYPRIPVQQQGQAHMCFSPGFCSPGFFFGVPTTAAASKGKSTGLSSTTPP